MLDYLRREKRVTPKNLISGDIPVGVEDEDTLFDLLPGQSAFTESPENRPLIGQLNVAVARLPERERLAVELSFFRELTHEEIAASLGVTRARVGQLLSRAIARLRNAMTQ
jgi:RNA polymerase sigma factor (sigma-70 family)